MSEVTQRSPAERTPSWRVTTAMAAIAIGLGLVLWPIGLIVSGALAIIFGLLARSLPLPIRIAVIVVGAVLFTMTGIEFLDLSFGSGHVVGSR